MNMKPVYFLMTLSLFVFNRQCLAQKNIIIDDSLAAHAPELKVKMGAQGIGKIWNFRFGDYRVGSSKLGWTTTTTKGNLFNTKTESISKQKFSFTLINKTTDTARVNAATDVNTESLHGLEIFPGFVWGTEVDLKEVYHFFALITLNGDSTNQWALYMQTAQGAETPGKFQAYLTNGNKKIIITPVTSNKDGTDKRSYPALGYEFIDQDLVIAALQYYGGGMMGTNKNIVWIHQGQEPGMQMILAAAITAILQTKN